MFKIITSMLMVAVMCILTACCGKCCGVCGGESKCSSGKCGSSTECSSGVCGVTAPEVSIKHLELDEFAKVVDNKSAVVLDARSGKWDDGKRVPGAKSLSSSASEADITKMLPDKSQAIVTYCSNTKCPASKMLATKLVGLGYTNVSEYAPGIKGWMEAGKPVEMAK